MSALPAQKLPRHVSLLAQADLLLLTADLLSQPWRVAADAFSVADEDLRELLHHAGLSDRAGLEAALLDAVGEARSMDRTTWGHAYTSLFEGAVPCPPNESVYVRRDKGAILADICGFFRAFGFQPADDHGEKPDHIVSQLQFTALLLVMLGEAVRHHHQEQADVTRSALARFTGDHISEWLPLFAQRLEQTSDCCAYECAARLLTLTWDAILDANDLPRPIELAPGVSDADLGTPYECDMADGAAGEVELRVRGLSTPV